MIKLRLVNAYVPFYFTAVQRQFFSCPSPESAPPLPALHCIASYKFVLALEIIFETCARMSKPGGCLLGPSQTHFFPTGGFFTGNQFPKASPTARTTRFCIAQVCTRVGETFREFCPHAQAGGVSTRPLTNSIFLHRRFFHGQPTPESAPPTTSTTRFSIAQEST